jgi:hypothetical protein
MFFVALNIHINKKKKGKKAFDVFDFNCQIIDLTFVMATEDDVHDREIV